MIYTERDKLTIIELDNNLDTLSFDALAKAILDRPSNDVYCEYKGKLYGIISMGDIERASDEGADHVAVNKNFTYVSNGGYMQARSILGEKKNINSIPAVDNSNVLLGAYSRWDDLLCNIDMSKGAFGFYKYYNNLVLVRPCSIYEKKQKLFESFKKSLLSYGIMVKDIKRDEITGLLSDNNKILFVDEDELRSIRTLYAYIWKKDIGQTMFSTYKRIADEIYNEEVGAYLKHINKNGVCVINLLCEGNESYYPYRIFMKKIKKKYAALGKKLTDELTDAMYQEFFDDLYTADYADCITHLNWQIETKSGCGKLKDCKSQFCNVTNGERHTCEQPKEYKKTIYFIGPCYIYGHYVEDCNTIESFLQKRLNEMGYEIRVVNVGSPAYNFIYKNCLPMARLKSLLLKKGDIVLYGSCTDFDGIEKIRLMDIFEANHMPIEWVSNQPWHGNHHVNLMYADAIYHTLEPILKKTVSKQGELLHNNEDFIKTNYIDYYFKDFVPYTYQKIGSIVMNCNPFTYGHRYLIEWALNIVDFLIIFVVQEDKSLFSFTERFVMVCDGITDLKNVMAVPSGPFILAQTTFPEYFIKEMDEYIAENVENDISIFAKRIAPYLNIRYRFVGEEPEDMVTNEYNCAMKKILPENGIQLIEVPRKKIGGRYISASLVRKSLDNNDMERLNQLVPKSTQKILFETSLNV